MDVHLLVVGDGLVALLGVLAARVVEETSCDRLPDCVVFLSPGTGALHSLACCL